MSFDDSENTSKIDMSFDDSENTSKIDIGYLEKTSPWKLASRFFPSKVGGKPSWLDLEQLPSASDLKCCKCSKPCILLCQVYAPIEEDSSCFHRTVFVFVCADPECCDGNGQQNFKVFRCQLERDNKFFPFDPPVVDSNWRSDIKIEPLKLCHVCGCRSVSHCGKCKKVGYCCKEHQVVDWKAVHKEDCGSDKQREAENLVLPEFELLIEPEDLPDEPEVERSDEEKIRDYEKLVEDGALGSMQGESSVDEDLLKMAVSQEDKEFKKFSSRIKNTPDQVLRYDRAGEPLWVSANQKPDAVPDCHYCGGQRQFEFQILPQMLNYLNLDDVGQSIDWGVLVIYTCKANCNDGPAYKQEYLWKQDFGHAKE